jgi:hypothetical protein
MPDKTCGNCYNFDGLKGETAGVCSVDKLTKFHDQLSCFFWKPGGKK